MNDVIYHNPRCSKSRQTLELLKARDVDVKVVEYLKTPPSAADLKFICKELNIKPQELIRSKDQVFKDLGLSLQDKRSGDGWIKIMVKNPALIERPIVVYKGKAAVGRPPGNVLNIIK